MLRHYPEKHEHWVPVTLTVPQVKMQFELAKDSPGPRSIAELMDYNGSVSPMFLTKARECNTHLLQY